MKKIILLFLFIAINNISNAQWLQLTAFPSSTSKKLKLVNGFMISCSLNGGVYRSSDNGNTWSEINNNLLTSDSKKAYDLQFLSNKLFLATVDGIYVSGDNGDNWQRKSNGMTIGPGATNIFALSVYESDGIFYAGTWNGIYYSTDEGENWNISNISGQGVYVVSFLKYHGDLYAGRDAINTPALYRSTDSGLNWTTVNIWNNFPLSVFCFYAEGDTLFVGTAHGMWVSSDNGVNWTNRSVGLTLDPYVSSIIKTSMGNVMIASLKFGGSGVFKSYNNGILWEEITDNLPFVNEISELNISGNNVYASTSDKIWYRDINEIITSVTDPRNPNSKDFSLSQNYPNPFNPVTQLEFGISKPGFVSLKVYDALGNEVKTLVNEVKSPGRYNVTFDGSSLASGVYFYKLISGDFTERKTMLLLK